MPALSEVISEEIDRWGMPEIERLLFGTADPQAIAETVSQFCQENLGCPVSEGLFYRASVGSVFGVVLDGRSVVLKVYQPPLGHGLSRSFGFEGGAGSRIGAVVASRGWRSILSGWPR